MRMDTWKAAVSIPSQEMARIARRTLTELGYGFSRDTTYKHFTRFAVVLPLPEAAYTFRFWVETPSAFVLDLYTTRPTHTGVVHFVEVSMIEDVEDVRRFLRGLAERMPRLPWKFSLGDRFRYGFAVPEFVSAKRRWRKMIGPSRKSVRGEPEGEGTGGPARRPRSPVHR